ncbi:MAG: hypothetical protein LIR50_07175 [Bacillota bacterium]|nr:hypothetical protein [Bacillota bacterium]
MTLKDMKVKTFSLIEEYYPEEKGLAEDEDVLNKINGVVNQIQTDLMKYRKINANTEIEVALNDDREINLTDYIDNLYQIDKIVFDKETNYDMITDTIIVLPEDYEGTFKVYYYKYPELCDLTFKDADTSAKYDKSYEFELDPDLLEVMPYGIAADLLKMDMISNYGRYFKEEYEARKNTIDSRRTSGRITFMGGTDI